MSLSACLVPAILLPSQIPILASSPSDHLLTRTYERKRKRYSLRMSWPNDGKSPRLVRSVPPRANVEYLLTCCRKQKMTYVNEGAEKAKQEEEVANRKRKVEQQTKWEGELHCSFSLSLISAIWRVLRVFQTGVSTPICHYFSSSLMSARRTYADTMVFSCFFCFSFLFLLAFRRTTRRSDTSLERFQHEKAKEIEEERACSWIVQARFTKNLRVPPLPIPLPLLPGGVSANLWYPCMYYTLRMHCLVPLRNHARSPRSYSFLLVVMLYHLHQVRRSRLHQQDWRTDCQSPP